MELGRYDHDPVGDARRQEIGKCEVAQVMGADLHFEAVDGALFGNGHDAGVVDQDVDRLVDGIGERANGREIGEVELAHDNRS